MQVGGWCGEIDVRNGRGEAAAIFCVSKLGHARLLYLQHYAKGNKTTGISDF
ncbi:MAG: hypothetical protein RLZZ480_506 [Candidatus Parcubacteria bacterium]|jgi:hypothetical protein